MSNNMEGRVVVITGASSGSAGSAARLLSRQGASVVLEAGAPIASSPYPDDLTGADGKPIAIATDFTDRDQVSGRSRDE